MQDIDNALNNAFAQRQVSTIYTQRNQYRVILEVDPQFQRDPTDLSQIYVAGAGGTQVPLSSVARVEKTLAPLVVNHQGQFPAVTISFNLAPDVHARAGRRPRSSRRSPSCTCPTRCTPNSPATRGRSSSSAGAQPLLILAALLAIYIVLGVLYESLAHPLTIISTLPSAGLGALLALQIFGAELTIIAFIGIILLIGIVKKNGIMLVDFALEAERQRGLPPAEAIHEACLERFRPILMTTMAALLGAVPLVIATGPGLGAAPAARHHHHRRAARVAGADALHDAGDLPAARPAAPAARRPARGPRFRRRPQPAERRAGVARAGMRLAPDVARTRSALTASITSSQSPGCFGGYSLAVGYHGLSGSQRQSMSKRLSTHTGLPSAPVRCAVEVSTEITRSRLSTSAAVSEKSLIASETSTIRGPSHPPLRSWLSSPLPGSPI